MEAPEKNYLFENPIDGTPDYRWLSKRSCSDDIEFEKAEKWLMEQEEMIGISFEEDFIERFKNYMKGK